MDVNHFHKKFKTAPAPTGTVLDALRRDTPHSNFIVSSRGAKIKFPGIFMPIFKKGWYDHGSKTQESHKENR